MHRLLLSSIAALIAVLLVAGAGAAQPGSKRDLVDMILTRAVLERGAFLACARLDQSRQTADQLTHGWEIDLADAMSLLRSVGYSDADINALEQRYDIRKAAPKFADLESLGAYCSVLGDWRTRWTGLQIMIPTADLRRALGL